jgi:hypothetical protein
VDPTLLVGPVTTRLQVIGNFDTFILNNIPYALVSSDQVRWGSVYCDGPDAPGVKRSKPALQWHFGGVPYPISKAIRIPYSYIRTWDGSDAMVPASIFIGFQQNLDKLVVPQPIPWVEKPSPRFAQNAAGFGALGTPFWGSDAALLGSEAAALVSRSIEVDEDSGETLHKLVCRELDDEARFRKLETRATPIDLDGLAKDNDSQNVFQYMVATVVNDPAAYGRLLHWYFGGKAYSLTKAIRIWLDYDYDSAAQESFVASAAASDVGARLTELASPDLRTGRALFIGYGGGVSDNG